MEIRSTSEEETIAAGKSFAKKLKAGDIVRLEGELGAGKTHFVKGIASYFGIPEDKVSSPTFTIVNEYNGDISLFHFDCYRILRIEDAIEIGTEEYLFGDGISVIEWASKIEELLPKDVIVVKFKHINENERNISISFH